MSFITVFAIFLLACHGALGDDGPVIKSRACDSEESLTYDACMHVRFANGVEDVMVLNKYMGEDSILVGSFKNDPSVYVALSKDTKNDWSDQPFSASFHSINEPGCGAFEVAADGKASCSKSEYDDRTNGEDFTSDYILVPFEEMDTQEEQGLFPKEESRALSKTGYGLDMFIYYDDNMVKRFGSAAEAEVRVKASVAHAQSLFKLPSLTTTIKINLVGIKHYSGDTWTARSSELMRVRNYAKSAPNAQSYVFFGSENDRHGTVGVAFERSTCAVRKIARTAIVEYSRTDVITGAILAHEVGHNLGMGHDFVDGTGARRTSSDGTACRGIGGIMDYYGPQNTWSKCSVEDFTSYHDSKNPFCLPELDANGNTTPKSCVDKYPDSCPVWKQHYGCSGQLWNEKYCVKTCALC